MAELGRLEEAVATLERAVLIARSLGEAELAAHLASVQQTYRSRQAAPPRR